MAETEAGADQHEPCKEGHTAASTAAPNLSISAGQASRGKLSEGKLTRRPQMSGLARPEEEVQHARPQQEVCSIMQ